MSIGFGKIAMLNKTTKTLDISLALYQDIRNTTTNTNQRTNRRTVGKRQYWCNSCEY